MKKPSEKLYEPSAVIRMKVSDDDGFLSPYFAKDPIVSEDVMTFLDNAVLGFHTKDLPFLKIVIQSDVICAAEERTYADAIHNAYNNRLVSLMRQSKRSLQSSIGMFIFGAVVLTLNVGLTVSGNRPVTAEIFDCLACAFLWESIDQFWFDRYNLRQDEKRAFALCNCPIRFEALNAPAPKDC